MFIKLLRWKKISAAGHSRQASTESYAQHIGSVGSPNAGMETEFRQHLIVAVGSPLPTPSQPAGLQQGPVVLTAKNLQCMRLILGNVLYPIYSSKLDQLVLIRELRC